MADLKKSLYTLQADLEKFRDLIFNQLKTRDPGRACWSVLSVWSVVSPDVDDDHHLKVGRQKTLQHFETIIHPLKHTHLVGV